MSDQTASHSGEAQETAIQAAREAFGLNTPEDVQTPTEGQQQAQNDQSSEGESSPAIEKQESPQRMIKVKHNKQDVEVDVSDDKLPEYVQKALALDKERERKTEYEKNLDRVAKLQGFNDHADLVANLDRLEQEAKQREQDKFADLRQSLRDEAEYSGIDVEKLDAWLDNHPLLQQAKQVLNEREQAEQERNQQTAAEQWQTKWQDLYTAFPDLTESAKAFGDGNVPDWYTPDMQARIERGYDPLDAYQLAHRDKLQAQTKKQAEQKAIKDQRLGLRSQVESTAAADLEPEVPDNLATAFAMFGLDPRAAKKYVK